MESNLSFEVRAFGLHGDHRWRKVDTFIDKATAERKCFELVHSATATSAIVVEYKPVVITRVGRKTGEVSMTYPNEIMDDHYR